jgi:hypothetical protein
MTYVVERLLETSCARRETVRDEVCNEVFKLKNRALQHQFPRVHGSRTRAACWKLDTRCCDFRVEILCAAVPSTAGFWSRDFVGIVEANSLAHVGLLVQTRSDRE